MTTSDISCNRVISRNVRRFDPTRTTTVRNRYAQRLRGELQSLNADIRRGVTRRDVFGINAPPDLASMSISRQVRSFMSWLEREEQRTVLDVISPTQNEFIRVAYIRGIENADREARKHGLLGNAADDVFERRHHQDAVEVLYERNFRELEGITSAMNQQISRELADGLTAGEGPAAVARRITDRVDSVGKHRATVMARTEIVNAHTHAALNRFERLGVEGVTVKAELETAGDDRTCEQCASLEGTVMTIEEARKGAEASPPVHPQCRCALVPVVE